MPFEPVTTPLSGAAAFEATGDAAVLSQAAMLLTIGAQMRGDITQLARNVEFQGSTSSATASELDDEAALGLPKLAPVMGRSDTKRIRELLYGRYDLKNLTDESLHSAQVDRPDVLAELAKNHFREPNANSVFNLLEVSLLQPNEIVRVAAAAAYIEHSSEKQRLLKILEAGVASTEPLVQAVAATALAHENPANPVLQKLLRQSRAAGAAGAANTTMLIHGTWAANSTWWQPGGNFHNYILQSVRPDLYAKPDRFGWSGGYSDAARAIAAQDLVDWVNVRGEQGLDLITHSHGGNVSFLATTLTPALQIGELILLSCPVHFPKYMPNFSQITKKAVSIRVHMDLVILADRGGQRFRVPQISENVLGIWFDHTATHDPAVWQKYNVPSMI